MSAPEYRIATIADFLQVPAEKQAELLRDFATWLTAARDAAGISQDLTDLLGGRMTLSTEYFTWIDDGVPGCSAIDLRADDGEQVARVLLPKGGAQ